jgi:hypothetical protein
MPKIRPELHLDDEKPRVTDHDPCAQLRAVLEAVKKERDRCLVLATKWCPREHHDWQEVLAKYKEQSDE